MTMYMNQRKTRNVGAIEIVHLYEMNIGIIGIGRIDAKPKTLWE